MTYATLEALTDRYGLDLLVQVTDRAVPPSGVVDQAVVDRALADTDATIDASLAVRYQLPLAQVPAVVTDLALSISIYKLHRFSPEPKIETDYNQALKSLTAIATGAMKLDVAGLEPSSSGASGVIATDRCRPLEADKMTGFI